MKKIEKWWYGGVSGNGNAFAFPPFFPCVG